MSPCLISSFGGPIGSNAFSVAPTIYPLAIPTTFVKDLNIGAKSPSFILEMLNAPESNNVVFMSNDMPILSKRVLGTTFVTCDKNA